MGDEPDSEGVHYLKPDKYFLFPLDPLFGFDFLFVLGLCSGFLKTASLGS